LKSEGNKKLFQRLDKILGGSDGIVYLMFLGRDTYAAKIKDSLVGTIYKHDSNVNQAVKRLLKHGSEFLVFKRRYREEGTPGREAEIYTASFDPIFLTLKASDIDFNEKELQHTLECLSPANDSFPQYLINVFEISTVRNMSWDIILANYFSYMPELLLTSLLPINRQKEQTYSLLPTNIAIPKDKIDLLLSKHPDVPKKFKSNAARIALSSEKTGLNPELRRALAQNLPNIDLKLFETIRDLLNAVEVLARMQREMEQCGFKDIQSLSKYWESLQAHAEETMEKLRETDEFLKWKSEKDKKKES